MTIESTIREILADILDAPADDITPESFVIRDLDAESIDLLELSAEMGAAFDVVPSDDTVFLLKLREFVQEGGGNSETYLSGKYPHLEGDRIGEILNDMDNGPVLKVKDIIAYITYIQNK